MSLLAVPSNIAGELYVRLLSRAYQRGHRIYDPDYAHIQDTEAYEKMRRDPEIAHAMQFRRHLVAGREFLLEPAEDTPQDIEAANIMHKLVKEIKRFAAARFDLANAVFRGSSYSKIEGSRRVRDYGDGVERMWWVPTRMRDMDRWRFRQVTLTHSPESSFDVNADAVRRSMISQKLSLGRTRWEYWDVGHFQWRPLTKGQKALLVTHSYMSEESSLGYGRGLLEALYHFYWAKTIVMREGLQGIEKWAQGWIVAEVDGLRSGSTDRDNDSIAQDWLDELEKMRGRHNFVHDINENITIHETSGSGHEIVMSFLNYLDNAMTKLILAGVMPTGGGSGDNFGSFAKAKVEAESTESLLQYDRDLLSEDLTSDLIGLLWALNRSNFVALGLGKAKMPRLQIQHQKENKPMEATKTVVWLLNAGVELRRDEVYRKIGYTPPLKEDDILRPTPPMETVGGLPNIAGSDGGGLSKRQNNSPREETRTDDERNRNSEEVDRKMAASQPLGTLFQQEEIRSLVYDAVKEAIQDVEEVA